MDGRQLPPYAVFDDFRYSQRIAVVVRWFLLASFLFLYNYRPDFESSYHTINGLAITLVVLNGYVHWRIRQGRPITWPYVFALSATDLAVITASIFITSAFRNTFSPCTTRPFWECLWSPRRGGSALARSPLWPASMQR